MRPPASGTSVVSTALDDLDASNDASGTTVVPRALLAALLITRCVSSSTSSLVSCAPSRSPRGRRRQRGLRPDPQTEAELIGVLESFCRAFADRDGEAVMRLLAPDADVVVVTSEEPLLRGHEELVAFLDRYVRGATTYSWEWRRHDVSTSGSVAWLLAEGIETATSERGDERHPYRMTMLLERRGERWLLTHVHGSSPH